MSTFEFLGQEFSYAEESPYESYAWLEFCAVMAAGDEVDSREANAAARGMALASVAKSDLPRFLRLCRKENPPITEFMEIAQKWGSEVAERPTSQPTDSSDGQPSTPETSESKPVASVTSLPKQDEPQRISAVSIVAARKAGLIPA